MKSMKEMQARIREFCKKNKLHSPPEHLVLDLMSELGEVSKEVLKMSDYGRKPIKPSNNGEIESELGDALYSLITVSNYFDVDLEKALDKVLEKYEKRLKKGSAGSEND